MPAGVKRELGSQGHRGIAVVRRNALVSAGVEQRAHDRDVAIPGREAQRGDAAIVREVLVGAGAEQRSC